MSLNFAGISPHPPIIIPEIGKQDVLKVEKTVKGMLELGKKFAEAEIDTLIVISPHSLIYPDRFNICGMENLSGNFAHFDAPAVNFSFENDFELAQKIYTLASFER